MIIYRFCFFDYNYVVLVMLNKNVSSVHKTFFLSLILQIIKILVKNVTNI